MADAQLGKGGGWRGHGRGAGVGIGNAPGRTARAKNDRGKNPRTDRATGTGHPIQDKNETTHCAQAARGECPHATWRLFHQTVHKRVAEPEE